MKYKYIILVLSLALFSCGENKTNSIDDDAQQEEQVEVTADEAFQKILDLEEKSIGANNIVSNANQMELKKTCEEFDKKFYNDPRAEQALQKAVKSSLFLNNFSDAIILMDKIIKNYGTTEKMPELLFQKAFLYSQSNWLGEADKIYSKIIKEYPNHELAEQSKLAQEILFLSDEELNARFSSK